MVKLQSENLSNTDYVSWEAIKKTYLVSTIRLVYFDLSCWDFYCSSLYRKIIEFLQETKRWKFYFQWKHREKYESFQRVHFNSLLINCDESFVKLRVTLTIYHFRFRRIFLTGHISFRLNYIIDLWPNRHVILKYQAFYILAYRLY